VQQFAAMGYRMVIFPMTTFRVMVKAVEGVLTEIRDQGTPAAWAFSWSPSAPSGKKEMSTTGFFWSRT